MDFKRYAHKPQVVEAAIAKGDGNAKTVEGFTPYCKGDALIKHIHVDTVNVRGVPKNVEVVYFEVMSAADFEDAYELAPKTAEVTDVPPSDLQTGEIAVDPTTKEPPQKVPVTEAASPTLDPAPEPIVDAEQAELAKEAVKKDK